MKVHCLCSGWYGEGIRGGPALSSIVSVSILLGMALVCVIISQKVLTVFHMVFDHRIRVGLVS